ncbi:putative HECT-like Ubiquitin-conjugating enzyme (E2)-binding [Lyophyllum shimeji]|uniref:HECT-like Ubiquitin-conjugating enzyme (E2)-binding n=1 Tax=Lyophyllum shimeji TaxID=47721 RepID=A0A9P3UR30_LYOSH|nr:putative HECT-like Ubiquitin-conjugating enzyme (E2)-binding [Lyophyllum shimeji]
MSTRQSDSDRVLSPSLELFYLHSSSWLRKQNKILDWYPNRLPNPIVLAKTSMATLTRPKHLPRPASTSLLTSAVPAPFPRDQLIQAQEVADASSHQVDIDPQPEIFRIGEAEDVQDSQSQGVLQEVMPSIVHVQKSCLMTLNNLLSMPTRWNPIVPDRRHSMPTSIQASGSAQQEVAESSSALQTLVTNLRNRGGSDEMVEVPSKATESELLHELRTRVENISSSLDPADAELARSLVTLLAHFHRLSTIQSNSPQARRGAAEPVHDPAGPSDPFVVLKRQLSELQVERHSSHPEVLAPGAPPVLVVEAALLWTRIDEELDKVVTMCKERTEGLGRCPVDGLPPQYDPEDYELDTPPEYNESGVRTSIEAKSKNVPHSPTIASKQMDEKMRLDLEGVAMAIERLYLVAPQLHNQRVELKSSKRAQMEKASREGTQTPQLRSGKQKERQKEGELQELERMLDLLGKANQRSLSNQSVILEGGLPARMAKARQKDIAKRDALVEQLVTHSEAGRLHNQDAVLQTGIKDPNTLLTLPEFIRETVPTSSLRADPRALLTLPEFVKELPPLHLDEAEDDCEIAETSAHKAKKRLRHRSLSAPALSWLRSSSKSGSNNNGASLSHSRSRSRGMNALPSVPNVGFEVNYVAENHENLQHVLVFFTVTGATPGADIEAEVLPPFPENHAEGGDRLIIRSGPRNSLPLLLPARSRPGKQEVRVQSGHYEIKLTTLAPRPSPETANEDPPPLLDAAQLSAASPTSFICASCSLPLVQATKIAEYRDLPSEHWQELVDAWMCHTDQKLHEHVVKHGKGGFWPQSGQGLVGGSYILFEESSMTLNNFHLAEEPKPGEEWRLVRCLCGAVVGRCQDYPREEGKQTVFRLLKFAIRPVSLTSEPTKIPLSAFIVEDMTEFVRAHATYRFVILDEEDELPRILIWLFKPSIRLAYTISNPYALARSASIHAAKVLYKILTPSERTADLKT